MDHQELVEKVARLRAELTLLSEERITRVDRSSRRRDQRLGGALVLAAVLALGLAGLGSASALPGSGTVFTGDLAADAVTSPKIADGTIVAADVKDEAIAGADIKDESIGGADVKDGGIGSFEVTEGSLTGADIADGSLTGRDLQLFNDAQCTGETVQGTAAVNADPRVPATYTTNWLGWTHSCTSQPVQVLRRDVGDYFVRFGGPARLAMVTSPGNDAAVTSPGPGLFHVRLSHVVIGDGGPTRRRPWDADFSILAY